MHFLIILFSSSLFHYFVLFFDLSCFFLFLCFHLCIFLFSFLVIGSCPFFSISVSFCLLDWVLLSFSSFFSCFFISFVLSFISFLLASHCWEVIALGVSLMYLSLCSLFLLLLKRWHYLHWYLYSLFLFVDFFLLPFLALLSSLHLLYSAHLCLYFCLCFVCYPVTN